MNRHYDRTFFRELATAIHARLPDAAVGLDVIAGFPGETEAEFANTCRLLEELPFSHLHVFPYQPPPRHAGGEHARTGPRGGHPGTRRRPAAAR